MKKVALRGQNMLGLTQSLSILEEVMKIYENFVMGRTLSQPALSIMESV